jgi:hypothetical protein
LLLTNIEINAEKTKEGLLISTIPLMSAGCFGKPELCQNRRKKIEYINWAEEVINELRGVNKALEELFDQLVKRGRERFGKSKDEG